MTSMNTKYLTVVFRIQMFFLHTKSLIIVVRNLLNNDLKKKPFLIELKKKTNNLNKSLTSESQYVKVS